ncbi:microtubule-associated tumor suppressor candidate 2 homolog isoform X1 [Corythoichthys intestinalis]|uniref:microtubule-associated tumor suppressor candidate 2 homolog isoform X1 n=1 Tax=Corythoichthys intestinalis TaxID=161448 RepID=UPI0025A65255|nr:microtubule-associated tumor suppressor candidate 2 homolog isoform X1 [Corythoichthys intestinalis]
MSIPTSFKGNGVVVERPERISKTPIQFSHTGDDNANQLSSLSEQVGLLEETGCHTTSLPPLVSQSESNDKMIIWGSEQQCSEPGLREIELVDCPDIHTFLRSPDEDDDEESTREGKDEGPMSISSSSTASSSSTGVRRNDNDSNKVKNSTEIVKQEWRKNNSHSTEQDTYSACFAKDENTNVGRGALKQSKSETNVFVTNLSTTNLSGSLSSALDSGRETFVCLPSTKTNICYANNTTSAQALRRAPPVDTNPPPFQGYQEKHDQRQNQEERGQCRNGSDGGLGQRRRTGFEQRVLPPKRQQLVRPLCQTEMGLAQNSDELSVQSAEVGRSPSNITTTVSLGHTHNGSNKKFIKSSLREPSDFSHLYSTCGVVQSRTPDQAAKNEVLVIERQPGSNMTPPLNTSKPSTMERRPQTQFTYRRNCSSPKKSFTPPHSPLRTPQGSPSRQTSMYLISKDTRRGVQHTLSDASPNLKTLAQGHDSASIRAPVKTNINLTGIPKAPLNNQQNTANSSHNSSPRESSPSPKLKPKGARPKIITYVRKNPQFKPQAADGPYQVSSLPARLSTYTHGAGATTNSFKDTPKDPFKPEKETRGAPVLSASNLLYDKYHKDMQTNIFPSGLLARSSRAPGHSNTVPPHSYTAPPKLGSKTNEFYGEQSEVGRSAGSKDNSADDPLQLRIAAQAGGSGSLLRSGRGLRLGLGAVTRTASNSVKGKGPPQSQRSTISQVSQQACPATRQKSHDTAADDEVFTPHAPASAQDVSSRSLLPKAGQSGLRAPGFSSTRVPVGRLAAFGFIRSSSVSSVSSAHSADSTQSDPSRTTHRLSVSEEPPIHRVSSVLPSSDQQRGAPCRSNSLQPPSTPALPRRYLPAQPRSSPGVIRKDFQRGSELTRSLPSSPKRLAVVPPKPQSPVQSGQRPAGGPARASVTPGSPRRVPPLKLQQEKEDAQQREERKAKARENEEQREELERLRGRCKQQEKQLRALKEELRKTSLGLEAFIITTQHYCLKNKTAEEKGSDLFEEIQTIKEQLVSNSANWERLKQEKSAVESAFERELQELQVQQEAELAAVEESLRKCHLAEMEDLKAEHQSEMEELRTQQQEQVDDMTAHHQAAIQELRDMHNITKATLHEEHARTMRDLRKAHEQQKMLLEEDFEKLRLSLQDQVDTLTFQNQGLRDKAKRFEEALRKSTDEQIVDALAPYQHIEKDLKSLKEVVEMKNLQIHQQEQKISDLEKVQAQKNVFLEEKVQVLQQQNEDLNARIERNLTLSRQLSEENANLQESVEKESTEKKRLSRNNEELLWRLQTSPLMSPSSSPLHRSFSTSPIPSSPLFSSSPAPPLGCHTPTHCQGCPQQPQTTSPFHTANQNYSPGPATPTHMAATNQYYSLGPTTPTHRAATNQNYSPGPCTPTHRSPANRNSAACVTLQR